MDTITLKKVAKRRKDLIKYHLWDLPDIGSMDAWVRQFSGDTDQTIAMIALDALIVKSKTSATSSLKYLLNSVLPTIVGQRCPNFNQDLSVPWDVLRQNNLVDKFRILRLERPNQDPGSGQSSDDMIRELKYDFQVNSDYFRAITQSESIPNVILVDEFSGSGNQAKRAIKDWIRNLGSTVKISVFFTAIHQTGLTTLTSELPDVDVYTPEILGDESCLFTHIKNHFELDSIIKAKETIRDFTERNFVMEDGIHCLGYKQMALCFKPPYTTCNNMAGLYLLKTKQTNVRLFRRGL